MKPFFVFIVLLYVITNASCIDAKINGSGNVITQERPTTTFNEIDLRGIGNVFVEKGSTTNVQVVTDDNIQEHININTVDNTLVISTEDNINLKPSSLDIYVITPNINHLILSGSGTISTNGILTAPTLSTTLSGSGKITATTQISGLTDVLMSGSGNIILSGNTQNLNAILSGSGNIKALSYPCQNASISLSGSGNIEVAPTDTLKGTLSGSGDVRYAGEPVKNVTITGSGNLVKVQ